MVTATSTKLDQLAGKYLTFQLGNEIYGLPILSVREIIGMLPITAVPHSPPHIKGVVNLRGRVIQVTDLRTRFGLSEVKHTPETCIIFVRVGTLEAGLIVDRVKEVNDIPVQEIEESPEINSTGDSHMILGMGKVAGKVVILLDAARVLNAAEESQNS